MKFSCMPTQTIYRRRQRPTLGFFFPKMPFPTLKMLVMPSKENAHAFKPSNQMDIIMLYQLKDGNVWGIVVHAVHTQCKAFDVNGC